MFFVLLQMLSCDEEERISGPSPFITSYPLQVGNRWFYSRTFFVHNVQLNDSTAWTPPDTVFDVATVEVVGIINLPPDDTLMTNDSVRTMIVKTTLMEMGTSFVSYHYYSQNVAALSLHGHSGSPSTIQPRHSIVFRLGEISGRSVEEVLLSLIENCCRASGDSITRESPPVTVLQFPLIEGRQWTYREPNAPIHIDKRIEDERFGLIGDHLQRYVEICWLYDLNNDGEWDDNVSITDFVSSDGLLHRTFDAKNLILTGPASPDTLGMFDVRDEWIVDSLSVSSL